MSYASREKSTRRCLTLLAVSAFGLGHVVTACSDATPDAAEPRGARADEGAPSADGSPSADAAVSPPGDTAGSDSRAPEEEIDPGPPAVQFVGRFDLRDPAGAKCAWPGCRIVARFDGTEVAVRMNEIDASWMLGGPSEWDVAIDGQWVPKLVLLQGVSEYVLARDLAPGPHKVELYKRSESQNGTSQFLGFDFRGGTLLSPPRRAPRRIEIIGDSQPAAFGVEGVGYPDLDCPGPNWAAMWQNFRRSFGARIGESFGAEVLGTVHSGKGLVRNIWRPDLETMPVLYPRIVPTDATSLYDFTSYVPHVVVIMIGGNDFAVGQPVDDGPTPLDEFTQAYATLVASIRDRYPEVYVFLSASPSVTDEQPVGRQSRTNVLAGMHAVIAQRVAMGDTHIHEATPALATKTELTGCEGHGTPEFHERVAAEISAVIREKTGW